MKICHHCRWRALLWPWAALVLFAGLFGCLDAKLVADIVPREGTDTEPLAPCLELTCQAEGILSEWTSLASLAQCTRIEGNLAIIGYDGEDLSELSCLRSVS
ncbi:MAG: hypothetical protein MUC50_15935, partial [Myxococcota bacterium]|nr:hypothetical protein [Myxococcota bacterium]